MNKPRARTRRRVDAIPASAAVSDDRQRGLSPATASWAAYIGRVQEETTHFAGASLGRYLEAADRFARCRTFADVADAQARFIGDLLSDFVDEGAMMVSALCEPLSDTHPAPRQNGAVP